MKHVLVIEDDLMINAGICYALAQEGYSSIPVYDCEGSIKVLETQNIDLVILDINLPDGEGFEICEKCIEVPVIILTARNEERDMLLGYDCGAEDYVTKPFSLKVLMKKVSLTMKKSGKIDLDICYHGLKINLGKMTIERGNLKLRMTSNEYKILKILLENRGRIVTREQLLDTIWDCDEKYITTHTLTVTINRLRKKIDEHKDYIETIHGIGYTWNDKDFD